MRLLFLGHSGTTGGALQRAEDAYPYLVLRALQEARPNQEHDVVIRPLVPTPTAAEYAEKVCRQVEPDVVVVQTLAYPLLATVDARVRHLFPRLYPQYARLRDALARLLAPPARTRPTRHLYSGLRSLLRAILGAELPLTPESSAGIYCAVLRSLAALESPSIIVISSSLMHSRIEREIPGTNANISRFHDLLRACAERMNVPFIDRARAFDAARDTLYSEDGIHTNAAGHRLTAELLLPHLLALGSSSRVQEPFPGRG